MDFVEWIDQIKIAVKEFSIELFVVAGITIALLVAFL